VPEGFTVTDWTRQGSDAGQTKYSGDALPTHVKQKYRKRFFTDWAGYTGNYFYATCVLVKGGQAFVMADDVDANLTGPPWRDNGDGVPLRATLFDWPTGKTLQHVEQPYENSENDREIDSHHYTNPAVWHTDGRIYTRRGGDGQRLDALDPASGTWVRIATVQPPGYNAYEGDAHAFLQLDGDTLFYRAAQTNMGVSVPHYGVDISAAAWAANTVGTWRCNLGPGVPRSGNSMQDPFVYGDNPKVADGVAVIAAPDDTTAPTGLWLEATDVSAAGMGQALWHLDLPSDWGGNRGFYTCVSDYWRFVAAGEAGRFVFFTRAGGAPMLYSVNLHLGAVVWSMPLDSGDRPLLACKGNDLYVIGRARQWRLRLDDGGVVWQVANKYPLDQGFVHKNYAYGSTSTTDPLYRPMVLTDTSLWFVHGQNPGVAQVVGMDAATGVVTQTIPVGHLLTVAPERLIYVHDLMASGGKLGILCSLSSTVNPQKLQTGPDQHPYYQDLLVYG
jgi:hypothetical protein